MPMVQLQVFRQQQCADIKGEDAGLPVHFTEFGTTVRICSAVLSEILQFVKIRFPHCAVFIST